jgi:hypothetical protein
VNHNLKFALAIASGLGSVTPASAQSAPPPATPQDQAKPADPMGEIVCQKQEVVGSRLATRRVCLTRLQWREQRTMDRQDVERAQIHPETQKPGG